MKEELIRLRLDPERETQLITYVKERRYSFMMMLYLSFGFSVLFAVAAFHDLNQMLGGELISGSIQWETELMMLANMIRRHRYYVSGELFFFWLMDTGFCIFSLFVGFGRKFGPGSDYHCLINQRYGFGTMIVGGKQPDCTKHPYYINDREGNCYACPVFLEYRNARIGDEMFCVVLDNGTRYAMEGEKKPWWESD